MCIDGIYCEAENLVNNTKAIIILNLMIIIWIGILFIEATRQPIAILGQISQLDKVAHFAAFSILGILVCGLSLKLWPKFSIAQFFMPLLVVTLCGALEECIQMFVPGRMASFPDLLADIGGALFAILLVSLLRMWGKGRLCNK